MKLEAGLRHRLQRVARQIEDQHRHLGPIWQELCGAVSAAADACARYREALRAHFELEEEVFFPALHGLHPERADELGGLRAEHEELLCALDAIGEHCECAELEASRTALDELRESLGRHEGREEQLARRLAAS